MLFLFLYLELFYLNAFLRYNCLKIDGHWIVKFKLFKFFLQSFSIKVL